METMASPVANLLLTSLSAESRDRILLHAVPVAMPLRFTVYRPEEIPEFAYFLTSGLVSIVMVTEDGSTAEVGVVGREGFAGSMHMLGPAVSPLTAFTQFEGTGLRIPLLELKALARSTPEISDRLLEYTQVQMLTISNTAGCNLLHPAEERLARWLLTADDRIASGTLSLTQEFLGIMLGVRRTTVNLLVSVLEGRGLVQSTRGRIRILDRERLEQAACDCYRVARRLQQNLYQTNSQRPNGMRREHARFPAQVA